MAFDKEELTQLDTILSKLQSSIALDTQSIVERKLEPILERLDQIATM